MAGDALNDQTDMSGQSSPPGLVIGATRSSAGKTVFTLALLAALRRRGLCVAAAKVGPDYIDTAYHAAITGRPAANLDTWMCQSCPPDRQAHKQRGMLSLGLQRLLRRMTVTADSSDPQPDLLIVEGAMGLYDGGQDGVGSTAQLAAQLSFPVVLLLDTRGMGQSVAAMAEGFFAFSHRHEHAGLRFLGIVCTHVGSERHAALLRSALEPTVRQKDVPLLGLLPRKDAPALPSRHLGLLQAHDALPDVDQEALARWLETHTDVEQLLHGLGIPATHALHHALPISEIVLDTKPAAATVPDVPQTRFFRQSRRVSKKELPTVGMAWDAAFSFCYADLPAVWAELGYATAFFSPLQDRTPPPHCVAFYFPGGYPELFAAQLAANVSMRTALRRYAHKGVPMYGECGGYIYLMRAVTVADASYALVGLLPQSCTLGTQRAALGYRAALAVPGWPKERPCGTPPLWVRGHEFHYARLDSPDKTWICKDTKDQIQTPCFPLWRLYDSHGTFLGLEGCRCGSVAGSWLHTYPEAARGFWRRWLQTSTPEKTHEA